MSAAEKGSSGFKPAARKLSSESIEDIPTKSAVLARSKGTDDDTDYSEVDQVTLLCVHAYISVIASPRLLLIAFFVFAPSRSPLMANSGLSQPSRGS